MTGPELLLALNTAGLVPHWTEAGLRLRGDPARFTPEIKASVREHRRWLQERFCPLGTSEEQAAELARLAEWFAAAALPSEPYTLPNGVRVVDAEVSHGWTRRILAENPRGQLRRALIRKLRMLKQLFGG